jgi:hypothetical protein
VAACSIAPAASSSPTGTSWSSKATARAASHGSRSYRRRRRPWPGLVGPPRGEPRPPMSSHGPARASPPLPPPPTCLLGPMVTSSATSLTMIRD